MAERATGPCAAWISADDVFDCAPCSSIDVGLRDAALAARVADAASELLYHASGRQFPGVCSMVVRPCRTSWCSPHVADDGTLQVGGCGCAPASHCGCPEPSSIVLPGPIIAVGEVKIDGVVLAASNYRVDEWKWLVRLDDEAWPTCQDLAAPTTDDNTFQVTYTRGTTPPESGVLAATDLACELYRGCKGEDCRIPQRVTNVVRQGVSMQFVSPAEIGVDKYGNFRTGLRTVDTFLAAFGRGGSRRRRGAIASPDIGPSVRRTAT